MLIVFFCITFSAVYRKKERKKGNNKSRKGTGRRSGVAAIYKSGLSFKCRPEHMPGSKSQASIPMAIVYCPPGSYSEFLYGFSDFSWRVTAFALVLLLYSGINMWRNPIGVAVICWTWF